MKKLNRVKTKQLAVFLLILLILSLFAGIIFYLVRRLAVSMIYRQMETQAEYYVNDVDAQIGEILRQQSELLVDRQMVFLVDESLLNEYEKRNTLLSIQEKLFIFISSNQMIRNAVIYIPSSNRVITQEELRELDGMYRKRLEEYGGQAGRMLLIDGELHYFLTENAVSETITPYFFLQIVLDNEQMISQMNQFSIPGGGVCWYNEQNGWFLEDTVGSGLGKLILNSAENSEGIEKIRLDGTDYLVSRKDSDYLGTLVQYCSEKAIMEEIDRYTIIFYCFILLTLGFAILFSRYTERLVNRPLQKLYEAFRSLGKGDLSIRITHSSGDEFEYIYENFNHTVEELDQTIQEVYVQKNLAAQAELKQLQAQISPHFLYNSFFLFSGRVRRGDYEGAEALADYLGTYFRYLARNSADIVSLSDEMLHAESYARIQESRFSARMKLIWEKLPEEAEKIPVPRLIVQPILENAFKHGLEEREEDGVLRVNCCLERDHVEICVEDNGEISEKTVAAMQNMLSEDYQGEITGLINVHRRLKGYFKQKGGLFVSRGELGGILVKMILPVEGGKEYASTSDRR